MHEDRDPGLGDRRPDRRQRGSSRKNSSPLLILVAQPDILPQLEAAGAAQAESRTDAASRSPQPAVAVSDQSSRQNVAKRPG